MDNMSMTAIEQMSATLANHSDLGCFILTRAHNGGWTVADRYGQKTVAAFTSLKELLAAFPAMVGED